MKTLAFSFCMLVIPFVGMPQEVKPEGRIIVIDELIHKLIAADAEIEILGKGFEWSEGPLWLESEKKLIFSDIPNNSIFEWSEKNGIQLYLKPSGYTGTEERGGEMGSNGLLLSPEGNLVLCMHGDRRMAQMISPVSNPKAEFKTLAGEYKGKKLNSPNDAVYSKSGMLYFTDPPYGLELNMKDPKKELDFQGVYSVNKKGEVKLLTDELSRPNGIAFSPDEKQLYIANSDPQRAIWMVYEVGRDGSISDSRIFYDATNMGQKFRGLPDGMKVHPNGWVFATGPGGVLVFTPGGKHLGTVYTGEATSNCAFNADFTELYMTADDYLLRLKLVGGKD